MLKKRGQISMDLLITLIVTIIVGSSLIYFVDNFKENNGKMLLENQLRTEAAKLSSEITSSQAMGDTNFTAEIRIDKVNYNGTLFYPEIIIDSDRNIVRVAESQSPYKLDTNSYYHALEGTTIYITEGYLVIHHE